MRSRLRGRRAVYEYLNVALYMLDVICLPDFLRNAYVSPCKVYWRTVHACNYFGIEWYLPHDWDWWFQSMEQISRATDRYLPTTTPAPTLLHCFRPESSKIEVFSKISTQCLLSSMSSSPFSTPSTAASSSS